jgi:hypothetical protein
MESDDLLLCLLVLTLHRSLCWAKLIHFTPSHTITLRLILILSSHLSLEFPSTFEVFTVVNMYIVVFWIVTLCSLVGWNQRFGGTHLFSLTRLISEPGYTEILNHHRACFCWTSLIFTYIHIYIIYIYKTSQTDRPIWYCHWKLLCVNKINTRVTVTEREIWEQYILLRWYLKKAGVSHSYACNVRLV